MNNELIRWLLIINNTKKLKVYAAAEDSKNVNDRFFLFANWRLTNNRSLVYDFVLLVTSSMNSSVCLAAIR